MSDEGLTVYMAAPVFSVTERNWNRCLAKRIEETLGNARVLLPQDFKIGGKYNDKRHWSKIFADCLQAIDRSDVVCAIVDGPDADSGTAFEIGYAHRAGIPVLALRTDFRQSQDRGLNIMLSQAVDTLMVRMSFDEDTDKLGREVALRIKKLADSRKRK
ncbi:MAG: nucleoside 2-deoxyribosyltransferase [Planctomycetes bacterium]|nr:nucleoside 2-deoxyribosyltransferase [Planctomycetota bacterium]